MLKNGGVWKFRLEVQKLNCECPCKAMWLLWWSDHVSKCEYFPTIKFIVFIKQQSKSTWM